MSLRLHFNWVQQWLGVESRAQPSASLFLYESEAEIHEDITDDSVSPTHKINYILNFIDVGIFTEYISIFFLTVGWMNIF